LLPLLHFSLLLLLNELSDLEIRHDIRHLQIPHVRRLLKPIRRLNQRWLAELPAYEGDPEREMRGE